MNTLAVDNLKLPGIIKVNFHKNTMEVALTDGRSVSIPTAWYPRLSRATRAQLVNYEISPGGYGIHWPDIDEDLSVLGFLFPGSRK